MLLNNAFALYKKCVCSNVHYKKKMNLLLYNFSLLLSTRCVDCRVYVHSQLKGALNLHLIFINKSANWALNMVLFLCSSLNSY